VFGYVVRRLIAGVMVLIVVSMSVFALFFYGPNDPAYQYCPETRCTPAKLEQIHHSMGLDRPAPAQYLDYMSGYVKSRTITNGGISVECSWPCLGVSFKYRVSVRDYLMARVPATLAVAFGGATIFLVLGVGIGTIAARRRGTTSDKAIISASLFVDAMPSYLLFLLSWLYFVQRLGWFPDTGYYSPFVDGPVKFVDGMLLPWLIIGIASASYYARFSRGSMIEVMGEDYVRTARAKGVGEGKIIMRHALRAAIVPVVTIFGLDFAGLLTGTIFVEKIFGIQGLGLAGLDAERRVDLPMVSACVLIAAALIVVANIVVDVLYSVIDPRVRLT
jgi:peptide/nickel transport system permease protein